MKVSFIFSAFVLQCSLFSSVMLTYTVTKRGLDFSLFNLHTELQQIDELNI